LGGEGEVLGVERVVTLLEEEDGGERIGIEDEGRSGSEGR
jgi:hypothetical protein